MTVIDRRTSDRQSPVTSHHSPILARWYGKPFITALAEQGMEPDQKILSGLTLIGNMGKDRFTDDNLFYALWRLNAISTRYCNCILKLPFQGEGKFVPLRNLLHKLRSEQYGAEDFQYILTLEEERMAFRIISTLDDYVQASDSGLWVPQRVLLTHCLIFRTTHARCFLYAFRCGV